MKLNANIISPEGAALLSFGQARMPCESHIECVAPPGLSGVSEPFPTAHAVGYDLPPSGLRNWHAITSRERLGASPMALTLEPIE